MPTGLVLRRARVAANPASTERFFKKLGLPNLFRKTDYHVLAHLVPKAKLDPEVATKLGAILVVAERAKLNGE